MEEENIYCGDRYEAVTSCKRAEQEELQGQATGDPSTNREIQHDCQDCIGD